MIKTALFSDCRLYRYDLFRIWDSSKKYLMVVGLNPSTADETLDDPTVRRCIAFAKDWGHGGLCMTNIFAYRATDPADMKRIAEPIGELNNKILLERAENAALVIAAWGVHGSHLGRGEDVRKLFENKLFCLGVTKEGHPKHPLYLKKTLLPQKY